MQLRRGDPEYVALTEPGNALCPVAVALAVHAGVAIHVAADVAHAGGCRFKLRRSEIFVETNHKKIFSSSVRSGIFRAMAKFFRRLT